MLQTTCFTSYKTFLKNKKRSVTSPPASFSAWILKKGLLFYSSNGPTFIVRFPLVCRILGNVCMIIICQTDCDVKKITNINFINSNCTMNVWIRNSSKNIFWLAARINKTSSCFISADSRVIRPKLCSCVFPQNFHARKLGETRVFFAINVFIGSLNLVYKDY